MASEGPGGYTDEEEDEDLKNLAERLGVVFDEESRPRAEMNLIGIRSESKLVSRRLDSRTYFVHDTRFGIHREAGGHEGPDEDYLEVGRRILGELDVPLEEIGSEVVV